MIEVKVRDRNERWEDAPVALVIYGEPSEPSERTDQLLRAIATTYGQEVRANRYGSSQGFYVQPAQPEGLDKALTILRVIQRRYQDASVRPGRKSWELVARGMAGLAATATRDLE